MFGKSEIKVMKSRDGRHCDLCGCTFPAVRCDKCSSQLFCLSCDDMYHRHPKRRFHLRKAVDPTPTPQARPVLPMKVSSLTLSPGDPSKMPLPPPRKKKPGKSIFDSFRRGSPSESNPNLPRKEHSWSDRLGSITKFMSNRPLPAVPDESDSNVPEQGSVENRDLSFIHKRVEEKPPALPQRQPRSQSCHSPINGQQNGDTNTLNGNALPNFGAPMDHQMWHPNQNDVLGFGTIRRQSQPDRKMESQSYKSSGMHPSSSASDLTSLPDMASMQPVPSYPYPHPMAPPPFGYPPMYPQYMPYPQYFGNSWANLASPVPTTTTDADVSDQSEVSSKRSNRNRYKSHIEKKAKRSQSVLVDRAAYPGHFYPYGPFPAGYPGPPWMSGPPEAPPSLSMSLRSLSRLSNTKDSEDEEDYSSSPVSRPKSSSSEISKNRMQAKMKSCPSSSSSEHEDAKPKVKTKASPATERKHLKKKSLSSRRSQESRPIQEDHLIQNNTSHEEKNVPHPSPHDVETPQEKTITDKLKSINLNDSNIQAIVSKENVPSELQMAEHSPWQCKHCTFINAPDGRICQVCCKTKSDSPVNQEESNQAITPSRLEQTVSRNSDRDRQDMDNLNSALDEAEKQISQSLVELLKVKEETLSSIKESASGTQTSESRGPTANSIDRKCLPSQTTSSQTTDNAKSNTPKNEVKGNIYYIGLDTQVTIPVEDTDTRKDSFCQTYQDLPQEYVPQRSGLFPGGGYLSPASGQRLFERQSSNVPYNAFQSPLQEQRFNNSSNGMYRGHSMASLLPGRVNEVPSPSYEFGNMGMGFGLNSIHRSLSRASLLGETEGWAPEYNVRSKPDFYLSMEELVERRRQDTMRAQGLELVRMIREAEQQGFTADDIQVALNNCGKQNPVHWLQENWKNVIRTVVTLASNYGKDKRDNDVGALSENEARDALRLHKGNIWAAVTECVEGRQRKLLELSSRGNFTFKEIVDALTMSEGDVEVAYAKLTNTIARPFLMRIWGSGEGVPNLEGVSPEVFAPSEEYKQSRLKPRTSEGEASDNEIWGDDLEWEEEEEEDNSLEERELSPELASCRSDELEKSEKYHTLTRDNNCDTVLSSDKSDYSDAFGADMGERYLSSTSIDEIYLMNEEATEEDFHMKSNVIPHKKKTSGFLSKLAALRKNSGDLKVERREQESVGHDRSSSSVAELEAKSNNSIVNSFAPLSILKQTFTALKDTVSGSGVRTDKSGSSIYEKRTIVVPEASPSPQLRPSKNDEESGIQHELSKLSKDIVRNNGEKQVERVSVTEKQGLNSQTVENVKVSSSKILKDTDEQFQLVDVINTEREMLSKSSLSNSIINQKCDVDDYLTSESRKVEHQSNSATNEITNRTLPASVSMTNVDKKCKSDIERLASHGTVARNFQLVETASQSPNLVTSAPIEPPSINNVTNECNINNNNTETEFNNNNVNESFNARNSEYKIIDVSTKMNGIPAIQNDSITKEIKSIKSNGNLVDIKKTDALDVATSSTVVTCEARRTENQFPNIATKLTDIIEESQDSNHPSRSSTNENFGNKIELIHTVHTLEECSNSIQSNATATEFINTGTESRTLNQFTNIKNELSPENEFTDTENESGNVLCNQPNINKANCEVVNEPVSFIAADEFSHNNCESTGNSSEPIVGVTKSDEITSQQVDTESTIRSEELKLNSEDNSVIAYTTGTTILPVTIVESGGVSSDEKLGPPMEEHIALINPESNLTSTDTASTSSKANLQNDVKATKTSQKAKKSTKPSKSKQAKSIVKSEPSIENPDTLISEQFSKTQLPKPLEKNSTINGDVKHDVVDPSTPSDISKSMTNYQIAVIDSVPTSETQECSIPKYIVPTSLVDINLEMKNSEQSSNGDTILKQNVINQDYTSQSMTESLNIDNQESVSGGIKPEESALVQQEHEQHNVNENKNVDINEVSNIPVNSVLCENSNEIIERNNNLVVSKIGLDLAVTNSIAMESLTEAGITITNKTDAVVNEVVETGTTVNITDSDGTIAKTKEVNTNITASTVDVTELLQDKESSSRTTDTNKTIVKNEVLKNDTTVNTIDSNTILAKTKEVQADASPSATDPVKIINEEIKTDLSTNITGTIEPSNKEMKTNIITKIKDTSKVEADEATSTTDTIHMDQRENDASATIADANEVSNEKFKADAILNTVVTDASATIADANEVSNETIKADIIHDTTDTFKSASSTSDTIDIHNEVSVDASSSNFAKVTNNKKEGPKIDMKLEAVEVAAVTSKIKTIGKLSENSTSFRKFSDSTPRKGFGIKLEKNSFKKSEIPKQSAENNSFTDVVPQKQQQQTTSKSSNNELIAGEEVSATTPADGTSTSGMHEGKVEITSSDDVIPSGQDSNDLDKSEQNVNDITTKTIENDNGSSSITTQNIEIDRNSTDIDVIPSNSTTTNSSEDKSIHIDEKHEPSQLGSLHSSNDDDVDNLSTSDMDEQDEDADTSLSSAVSPIRPIGHLRRMSFNTRKEAIFQERSKDSWFLPKKVEPFKPAMPKRTIKQQLEFERKVRKLVSDKKVRTYRKAEIVAQLQELNFEETEAIYAANECSNLELAITFLQQECHLCAGKYPIAEMTSMTHCAHKACKECIRAYFTIQIRDRTIMELLCPFCNEPDITDEDVAQDYFNHLDIMLKKLVEVNIHELFQRKLRDRVLMKDPNFRWCSQCSSGFIADPYLKRLICPDCKAITCASCRRVWEREHEGVSCEVFASWKDTYDPEAQTAGLAKLLTEEGIDCPSCHFRYALAKGGCMHFKCIQCQHDFCSGCSKPFKMGKKCGVSEFCAKLGLHAHHPRNCLFYLRDKEPEDLQRLLDMSEVAYNRDVQKFTDEQRLCDVMEQKETTQGLVDDICGKDVEYGFAGLCRVHYVEYLGQLVNKHRVDPIQIFDNDDLELVLKRASIRLPPKKYRESAEEYREKLVQLIQEELPLGETEGS